MRFQKDDKVILHSDQGSQYSSYEYKTFAKKYNIILSMSRRGNCYDNAVAESFLREACPWGIKLLKKSSLENRYFIQEKLQLLKYLNI